MKDNETLSPDLEARINEVVLDRGEATEGGDPVSCDKVCQDSNLINPDVNTLDRG